MAGTGTSGCFVVDLLHILTAAIPSPDRAAATRSFEAIDGRTKIDFAAIEAALKA